MSNCFARPRLPGRFAALLPLVFAAAAATAQETAPFNPPDLPPLGSEWKAANPYRGDAAIARAGALAFNHNCARCHGADAVATAMPAPDLRRLDRACRRIADETLQSRCRDDTDNHFRLSVLNGKTIVGVTHMPAWKGLLNQETVWAIKTFIDARSSGKP